MNSHEKYKTVDHHHFDFNYRSDGDKFDYPNSGLVLVECADGRWFVQQEFGDQYSQFPGILKSGEDVDTEPTFYSNVDDAARAAFAIIKQVYPGTPDERLTEFLES